MFESEFVDEKHYPTLLENAIKCLHIAVAKKKTTYIKVVINSKTKLEPFRKLLEKIFVTTLKSQIAGFIIQPSYGIAEPGLDNLLNFYDAVYPYYQEVRIVPQLQKIIGAP